MQIQSIAIKELPKDQIEDMVLVLTRGRDFSYCDD